MFRFLKNWLERDGPEVLIAFPAILLGTAVLIGVLAELWIKSGQPSS